MIQTWEICKNRLVFFQNTTLRKLTRYKQKENMQYEYDIKYDINMI